MCIHDLTAILSDKTYFSGYIHDLLATRERRIIPENGLKKSAVLIPLCWNNGNPCVLVTKRSMSVEHHKGEISFPGGRVEPDDEGIISTALRESHEEIGLRPDTVDVLGMLDDHITLIGYHITPVVGIVPYPYDYKINSEAETLLTISLQYTLTDTVWMGEKTSFMGKDVHIYYLEIDGGVVWGATARILKHFVDLIAGRTIPFGVVKQEAKAWVDSVLSKQSFYQDRT